MKLIIAGGRDYKFTQDDFDYISRIYDAEDIEEIVSGCATGADRTGEIIAQNRGTPVKKFPADWKKYGPAAGPIRNEEMAQYADAVALFPGGRGTDNMAKMAVKYNLIIFDKRLSNDINERENKRI